jgi:hypothetical protein
MQLKSALGASFAFLSLAAVGSAQLFSDNFDVDTSANWTVNKANNPAGNIATFAFDYSTYGIPNAPGSSSSRGLRLQANVTGGVFGGLSVSPIGQSFTGDFELRAHVWMNYLGPLTTGGSGTTQLGGLGIGTAGTSAQWPGGVQDSVWFAATMDGGSASDYRAYSSAAPTSYPSGNAVYKAPGGAINNTNAYYSVFGGHAAPAAQLALYPSQTGTTPIGSQGFAWREYVVNKTGNSVLWTIDGLPIAEVDLSTVSLGGSNIHLMMSDTNATSATDPNFLNFVVFDNVVVTPEPGTLAVLGLGLAALRRRTR